MNYFISRGDQQYGPYSLADLQRYVQQGNIAPSDLARSEGMTDWVPVSQVIGNIGVPQQGPSSNPYGGSPYGAPATPYSAPAATPYGAQRPQYGAGASAGSYGTPANQYGAVTNPYAASAPQNVPVGSLDPPPSLHWALVLLFSILSCTLFFWIWAILEAVWVRKIRPENNGLFLYIACAVAFFGGYFAMVSMVLGGPGLRIDHLLFVWIWRVVCFGLYAAGSFAIRPALEDYYNNEEPIGLQLSAPMTFFCGIFYFQYHFTRIREMKDMQMLQNRGQYPGQYYGR